MTVIECNNLTKQFGKKTALDNVNFQIEDNSITGLIGRNGSGKTTFMKLACGILKETSGEVKVLGDIPYDNIKVAKDVIYSFHNYPHPEKQKLKVLRDFYKNLFPNFDDVFASKLMKFYELEGKMKYGSLSQGMKSMFNFSMAMATRSKITFLDEPMLGMDAKTRKHAYEILLTEYNLYPRNFVISSHMLNEFDSILSDIILIDQGKIVFHKELDEIPLMAFRVEGEEDVLRQVLSDREVLVMNQGEIKSYAIVAETLTENLKREFEGHHLTCSMLRPEEVCIYYSSQKREEDLSCLWNEKNSDMESR